MIVLAFDLLLLNGESLLRNTLRERRTKLHASFKAVKHGFAFADSVDVDGDGDDVVASEKIQQALEEAITAKSEGLMVKTLDDNATYEPSKRSLNWLKLKKDYLDGVGADSASVSARRHAPAASSTCPSESLRQFRDGVGATQATRWIWSSSVPTRGAVSAPECSVPTYVPVSTRSRGTSKVCARSGPGFLMKT